MNRPPAFQTYANELLALLVGLSLPAVGAVQRLALVMWGQSADFSSFLDDPALVARTIGTTVEQWAEIRAEIQHPAKPLFEEHNGRLLFPYLKRQAAEQRAYSKARSEAGKKGMASRWKHKGNGQGEQDNAVITELLHRYNDAITNDNSSPSPSPSPKEKKTTKRKPAADVLNGHRAGFEIFWKAYPLKRGKGRAEKAFSKVAPDDVLLGTMLAKIKQASGTPQWIKDGGEFIPHPATWLNGKGWEDEYGVPQGNGRRLEL